MITITNAAALRVALHLIGPAAVGHDLKTIILEKNGTLRATNGFALIISEGAHDANEDTYLTFDGKPKLQKSTSRVTVEQGVLTEHGSKTKMHPVNVSNEGTIPNFDIILERLNGDEVREPQGPIDTIKAARIAEAYGLDSPQGTWLPTTHPTLMHLSHARDTDTILLVPVIHEAPNRFARKPNASPAPQPDPIDPSVIHTPS